MNERHEEMIEAVIRVIEYILEAIMLLKQGKTNDSNDGVPDDEGESE